MKKELSKLIFFMNICLVMLCISMLVAGFLEGNIKLAIFGALFLVISIMVLKGTYKEFLTKNRKTVLRYEKLNNEELEIVEDVKKLIKSVDKNIIISDFNVYKVKYTNSWFHYDKDTRERSVFIPFKKLLKSGKDFCFMEVLHEVLHSQNLRNNIMIFNKPFEEGLNQFLTLWLIENYSQKYKIPQRMQIASIWISKRNSIEFGSSYNDYCKGRAVVQDIVEKSKIDVKEMFIKYIYIQPEFFKSFVPSKYFIK